MDFDFLNARNEPELKTKTKPDPLEFLGAPSPLAPTQPKPEPVAAAARDLQPQPPATPEEYQKGLAALERRQRFLEAGAGEESILFVIRHAPREQIARARSALPDLTAQVLSQKGQLKTLTAQRARIPFWFFGSGDGWTSKY